MDERSQREIDTSFPPGFFRINIGHVALWITMVAGIVAGYATLSANVAMNTATNNRQDATIEIIREVLGGVRTDIAVGNRELTLMREAIQRIEKVQQTDLQR